MEFLSLRELEERFADGRYLPPEFIARIQLALGRRDEAFRWLERGVELRSAFAVSVQALWPEFEPLWSDERFSVLRRRVGLRGE